MAKSSGPTKDDVKNNVAGWDLVGFESGGSSGSSSSKGSSSNSSSGKGGSSGSSGGSDSGGSSYSPAYDKRTGVDYSRNQSLAGQVVRQGMYDVYYDDMGYAGKAVKVSDSPGYVVDGVTYGGDGNILSGEPRYWNSAGSGGGGAVSGSGGSNNGSGSMGFQEYLDQSGYNEYQKAIQAAIQAAVDKAVNGYNSQISTTNQDVDKLAQQAYVAKMLGQKNLEQQMDAAGYAGGMADQARIQTESEYQNNLNSLETQRQNTIKELQSAIQNAQLTGDMQAAQELQGYLQQMQSQWQSYVLSQQQMEHADYWNRQQMENANYWNQQQTDKDNYWNQQSQNTQNQTTAYSRAMQLLEMGLLPPADILGAAGLSQTQAEAIRSVYLNGLGGGTAQAAANTSSTTSGKRLAGYNNGSLTANQVAQLQSALGIAADGKWGSQSTKAAGGLSAEEAWRQYVGGVGNNGNEVYIYGKGYVDATQAERWLKTNSIVQIGYDQNGNPVYAVSNAEET